MQWRANLISNDSKISPYLLNHSVEYSNVVEGGESYANEDTARAAIESGINGALSSPAIYTDQQMYLRNSSNSQDLGSFDKVASKGSQRWAFNYITAGESYTNMFNLTPSVYVLEIEDLTGAEITKAVGDIINATKS